MAQKKERHLRKRRAEASEAEGEGEGDEPGAQPGDGDADVGCATMGALTGSLATLCTFCSPEQSS